MQEVILSVGIDIGTSTTQLIFCRLTIENLASSYTVPRISIVKKEVVYRSPVYITPLLSPTEIDVERLRSYVLDEYRSAGFVPADVKTGAVIITGETARKQNAASVLETMSGLAGDFVVAAAGPELESVLSSRGAGIDILSKELRKTIANLDVGGGTTNIGVFANGVLKGVTCLDIGGRLIQVRDGRVTYISKSIAALAESIGAAAEVGEPVDIEKLRRICRSMADTLAEALGLKAAGSLYHKMFTNAGSPLPSDLRIQALSFSGGVADFIYQSTAEDVFRYGDIGIILGREIADHPLLSGIERISSAETIRATVVGAGSHTTEISGSTISYAQGLLPLKNVPILRVSQEDERDVGDITRSIKSQLPMYISEGVQEQVAIALGGFERTSFEEIQQLATALIDGAAGIIASSHPLIIVLENDVAKALGHAINVRLGRAKPIVCIDGIQTLSGDYIDIGEPIADGRVVPVVCKTVLFNSSV